MGGCLLQVTGQDTDRAFASSGSLRGYRVCVTPFWNCELQAALLQINAIGSVMISAAKPDPRQSSPCNRCSRLVRLRAT
jgi:hypothetical protein